MGPILPYTDPNEENISKRSLRYFPIVGPHEEKLHQNTFNIYPEFKGD